MTTNNSILDFVLFEGTTMTSTEERRRQRRVARARRREATPMTTKRVYFIEAQNGLVKIGCAYEVELRLEELRAASPIALRLLGYVTLPEDAYLESRTDPGRRFESAMHHFFSGWRHHGEWFNVDIARIKNALEYAKSAGWAFEFEEVARG